MKVFRIAAIATTIGISTAGSVPNTKSRMISAPMPPIIASSSTLGPPPDPCVLASSRGSCPVTWTLIPGGRPLAAAARVSFAPLLVSNFAGPFGRISSNAVWRSAETKARLPVEKYEAESEPGFAFAARAIAAFTAPLCVTSPAVWKTTTFGGRTPTSKTFSVRWLAS